MGPTRDVEKLINLDSKTRQKICRKLNVPRLAGGDYKTLGGLIKMPTDEIKLASAALDQDPAEHVLAWWETNTSEATIPNLRKKLLHEDMRRQDVVEILDKRPQGIQQEFRKKSFGLDNSNTNSRNNSSSNRNTCSDSDIDNVDSDMIEERSSSSIRRKTISEPQTGIEPVTF